MDYRVLESVGDFCQEARSLSEIAEHLGLGGPGSSFSSWSSTLSTGHSRFASVLCGDHTSFTEGGAYRCHGHTVRPVKEGKK